MVNEEVLAECQRMWDEGELHEVELVGEGTFALIYRVIFKIPSKIPDDGFAYYQMIFEGDPEGDLELEVGDLDQVYPKKIEVQVWEKFKHG